MAKLSRGARFALAAAGVVLAAGGLAARSPRVRAKCRAAVIAFRDPGRVHDAPCEPCDAVPARAMPEIEQLELGGDPGRVNEADLADAGVSALSSLTLPDLQIPITPRTLRFVSYFATSEKGREAFVTRFRHAGRYRAFIEQSLRDAELPEDLLWLAAIESGFEPQVTSPRGGAGLFQLAPETAAHYGLTVSELQDERRSTPRSTAATVSLLRDLMDHYHRWDLALTAYDLGQDRLDEALAKLAEKRGPREKGKPIELSDLVEARLVPKETANFVPQIQAFAIVAANRGRFGLDDLEQAPALDFGEIAVPPGTPLSLVARAAGVSIAVVRDYNPGLLRDRTPPEGGDIMVSLPAEKVAAALAAFPALYAREMEKLAAASASASAASASASAAVPPSSASASASAPAPPPDRFTLTSGVIIDRKPGPGPDVTVAARIEVVPRGSRAPPSAAFDVEPVTVRPAELASALGRAAHAVHALATDAGDAAVEARRRAGEARRASLAKMPYGGSFLALGDKLFPAGHPLAGTVLVSPALPLTSVAIAEPPPALAGSLRITVTVSGATERGPLGETAERAFAGVLESHTTVAVPAAEERVELAEGVPSARVLFGWLAPSGSDAERAALRLAVLGLAHNEVGKVARALVADTRVAVHVRGFLDLGDRASVAAIEVVPAVLHDRADVERELGAQIAAFAERGPSAADLAAAKAQLRARLQAEEKHAGSTAEPREAALARIARTAERAEAVTADELRALVKRVFSPAHRVVVTTVPRG